MRVAAGIAGMALCVWLGGCATYMPASPSVHASADRMRAKVARAGYARRAFAAKRLRRPKLAATPRVPVAETTGSMLVTVQARPMKPFTPEWFARERAIDDVLRRKLDICRC